MELIFAPKVHAIACTQLLPDGVANWADDNGYTHLLNDPETPLGRIWRDMHTGDASHLDLLVELCGRQCYRAFKGGRDLRDYIGNILKQHHGSVLEHPSITFAISGVSRSLTHELVRHRVGIAVSQESQRYVDASDMNFIVPPTLLSQIENDEVNRSAFERECQRALEQYSGWARLAMVEAIAQGYDGTMAKKRAAEAARWALPNGVETRCAWTMNLRSERHLQELRASSAADLEIRRLFVAITRIAKVMAPATMQDFTIGVGADGYELVECVHTKV